MPHAIVAKMPEQPSRSAAKYAHVGAQPVATICNASLLRLRSAAAARNATAIANRDAARDAGDRAEAIRASRRPRSTQPARDQYRAVECDRDRVVEQRFALNDRAE